MQTVGSKLKQEPISDCALIQLHGEGYTDVGGRGEGDGGQQRKRCRGATAGYLSQGSDSMLL